MRLGLIGIRHWWKNRPSSFDNLYTVFPVLIKDECELGSAWACIPTEKLVEFEILTNFFIKRNNVWIEEFNDSSIVLYSSYTNDRFLYSSNKDPMFANCVCVKGLINPASYYYGFFIDNISTDISDDEGHVRIYTRKSIIGAITYMPEATVILHYCNPRIARLHSRDDRILIPDRESVIDLHIDSYGRSTGEINGLFKFTSTKMDIGSNLKIKEEEHKKENKDMVSYTDHTILTTNTNYTDHTTLITNTTNTAGNKPSITVNPVVTPMLTAAGLYNRMPLAYENFLKTGKLVGREFEIKDVKFSGDKVIVFWEDNTKTIVTMHEDEPNYDVEKAIMVAFTKKALSFLGTAKERSLDNMLSKWTKKYESEKDTIKAQIEKIKKRKAKKAASEKAKEESNSRMPKVSTNYSDTQLLNQIADVLSDTEDNK